MPTPSLLPGLPWENFDKSFSLPYSPTALYTSVAVRIYLVSNVSILPTELEALILGWAPPLQRLVSRRFLEQGYDRMLPPLVCTPAWSFLVKDQVLENV